MGFIYKLGLLNFLKYFIILFSSNILSLIYYFLNSSDKWLTIKIFPNT